MILTRLLAILTAVAADLSGHKLLVTSVRTGDTAWSPDGKWISFRRTDERYRSNPERMVKIYAEKPAVKRPVWVIRPDGSDAKLIEPLRFQMAIYGSRASWRPLGEP